MRGWKARKVRAIKSPQRFAFCRRLLLAESDSSQQQTETKVIVKQFDCADFSRFLRARSCIERAEASEDTARCRFGFPSRSERRYSPSRYSPTTLSRLRTGFKCCYPILQSFIFHTDGCNF
jgi:hypothetical protein